VDASAWLGWAALVVAIIAIPATIWATRRWGDRNARLELSVRATPILPTGVHPGTLAVTYRDFPVEDPHLVTVVLKNAGPRDLASAHFDAGRPVAVRFDRPFYGVTHVNGHPRLCSAGIGASGDEAAVRFEASLLKRGHFWSFSAVVEGAAEVTVDAPLIDTDIRNVESPAGAALTVRVSLLGVSVEVPLRRGPFDE
jgi:hypothetical protein